MLVASKPRSIKNLLAASSSRLVTRSVRISDFVRADWIWAVLTVAMGPKYLFSLYLSFNQLSLSFTRTVRYVSCHTFFQSVDSIPPVNEGTNHKHCSKGRIHNAAISH